MPPRVLLWSIVSALAGFLFGFDTVVISGAEQTLQALWRLSPALHGIVMGSALYGTVIGALLGSWPTDRLGRKPTLLLIGVLYLLAAIGSALAGSPALFIASRFAGGLGIGVSTIAAPLYISEIAPPAYRGRLAGMFQFNIVFGIIIAFGSNYALRGLGPNAWRWMLGVAAFPSLAYTLLCLLIPESPRWQRGTSGAPRAARAFWTRRLRRPILLAFLIAFFNQLSGINAVLYFAPRIFGLTGLGPRAAFLQSIGIGITNLIFTLVGLRLIDRLGRRTLLYIGSFGYIASLGLTSWAFFTEHYTIVPACIFAFIAAHAVGQGAVIWVFIAEIFPDRDRATGQALGSGTHWICAALLTTFFPAMVGSFPPGAVFAFFGGMMVLQLLWVRLMVPETKGVPLEDLERQLAPAGG